MISFEDGTPARELSHGSDGVSAIDRIRAERLVVLLRGVPGVGELVEELVPAGICVVEVTLDSPGAESVISRLRARRDVCVLAGTVRSAADVDTAAAAGAEACVSPSYLPEVVSRCREHGVPAIPGALTPTEIDVAWRDGAALVKLFPAAFLGAAYVGDVLAPLGGVPLLASGGIDAANAASFLRAGAVAVAAGSAITRAERPAEAARGLVAAVRSVDVGRA
jgi:2-dehydro-3-deoxyphosphogluconate aldolase / (4S)-4-hydroxy-2-oxoglutarate aldolase